MKEITVAWTMVKSRGLPPILSPQKRRKEKNLGGRSRITGPAVFTLTLYFLKGLSFLEAKSPLYLVLRIPFPSNIFKE